MTTLTNPDLATELLDELDDVRHAWREWTEKWASFERALRRAGYDTDRLEAYQVGTGSDEGAGQSMVGWLDEIETDLWRDEIRADRASSTSPCQEGTWPMDVLATRIALGHGRDEVWCAAHDAVWPMGFVRCTKVER